MLPIINIGPLALQTPGLILIIGLWAGLTQAEKYARRLQINPDRIYTLVMIALVVTVITGRLAYAAQNPAAFRDNVLALASLTPHMFDWLGGAIFGFLAALIYGQRKQLHFWSTLDALTPGLAIVAIAASFSQLASGDAYGIPAQLPWSIYMWGEWRHPSQIYAILAAVGIAVMVWPKRTENEFKPGVRFLGFLALSSFARLILEIFRADSQLAFLNLRTAQIVAWFILAAALLALNNRLSGRNPG